MRLVFYRQVSLFIFLCFFCSRSFAFMYGEHKLIGDKAFQKLAVKRDDPNFKIFFDILKYGKNGKLGFICEYDDLPLTYGALNGLAGDHIGNPFLLWSEIQDSSSKLYSSWILHENYIKKGFISAPDSKLASMDFHYVFLALANKSHFYLYGQGLDKHLESFNEQLIFDGLSNDLNVAMSVFEKLSKTNPITVYLTVHSIAVELAIKARKARPTNLEESDFLLKKAILFNSFADHFLEDMYSSGHMVTNRTIFTSFTNSKALHDFYSEHGVFVIDKKGDIWQTYGDGFLSKGGGERIIDAVYISLEEILDAFTNPNYIYDTKNPKVLDMIPLPFNTKLEHFLHKDSITNDVKKVSSILPERNYIRSRIANSIEFGINTPSFMSSYLQSMDLRFNFGNFFGKYHDGTKKGKLDRWHGYTVSYGLGRIGNIHGGDIVYNTTQLLKGGIRNNFDLWFTNSRFLGLTNNMETGLLFIEGKTKLAFIPSIGIQPGSLFKINYYNMRSSLRIPLQILLPLQFRFGALYTNGIKPVYFHSFDVTISF